MHEGVMIMREFPDFRVPGFDIDAYNERFRRSMVIIHARSADVSYPEHWGCLSVKCAVGGVEYYSANRTLYGVNRDRFLILNEGQHYASYIFSESPVDSFTINFPASLARMVAAAWLTDPEKHLEDAFPVPGRPLEFVERLYPHGGHVTTWLKRLYRLSVSPATDEHAIAEAFYQLLGELLCLQGEVQREIRRVPAAKRSIRIELYKRLHFARDYMDSCYINDIRLDNLGGISCLNSAYFLRAFTRQFGISPHQYLIRTRIGAAKRLLARGDVSVKEVCYQVGYQDAVSFIRLFKRHSEGQTPEQYQLAQRKKSILTY